MTQDRINSEKIKCMIHKELDNHTKKNKNLPTHVAAADVLAAEAAVVAIVLKATWAEVVAEGVRCRHCPSTALYYYWTQLAAGSKRSVSPAAAVDAAAVDAVVAVPDE